MERRRCRPIEDLIFVHPAARVAPGDRRVWHDLDFLDRDIWRRERVEGAQDPVWLIFLLCVKKLATCPRAWTPASVRPEPLIWGEVRKKIVSAPSLRPLGSIRSSLNLPAMVIGAVIFNGEFDVHGELFRVLSFEFRTRAHPTHRSAIRNLEVIADQDLGDLHGVERRAFAQIVRHHPEIEAVGDRLVFANPADIGRVFTGGVDAIG